jgi:hypothetical protein
MKKYIKKTVLVGLIGWILVFLCLLIAFFLFFYDIGLEKHFLSSLFSIFSKFILIIFLWGFFSLISIVYDVTQLKVHKILLEDNEVTEKYNKQEKHKIVLGLILNITFLVLGIGIQYFFLLLIFRLI